MGRGADHVRFKLRLADGRQVKGGVRRRADSYSSCITRWELEEQIARADAGQPLTVYEPKPGHVKLTAHHHMIHVDIRGAKILT